MKIFKRSSVADNKAFIKAYNGENPLESICYEYKNQYDINYISESDNLAEPLAYMHEFAYRLKNRMSDTVSMWRTVIAEIFFSRMFLSEKVRQTASDNIIRGNIETISPFYKTTFYELVLEELVKNKAISGFDGIPEKLTVYRYDNEEYALIMPGLIALPFASIRKDMFYTSPFFVRGENEDENRWGYDTVKEYFSSNLTVLKYFIAFLDELKNTVDVRSIAFTAVSDYIDSLYDEIPAVKSVAMPQKNASRTLEEALGRDLFYWLEKEYCKSNIEKQFLASSPFSENMLCFLADQDKMDNSGFQIANTAMGRYRFDYNGEKLTPVKVQGFCNEPSENHIYVVPPVSEVFFNGFNTKKDSCIYFKSWNACTSADCRKIDVCVNFTLFGINFSKKIKFDTDKIFVTKNMPYICMWPYADIDWHEFFVCAMAKEFSEDIFSKSFSCIENEKDLNFIRVEEISVGVPYKNTVFNCSTKGVFYEEFDVIRTDVFPDAISLSSGKHCFGYWIVDKSQAKKQPIVCDKEGIIGLDFATTASVVKLRVENNITAIDGPGEYLYDIFNPNYGTVQKTDEWENIHNYTLLGSAIGKIHKIYTYGQNNIAYDDCEKIKQTRNVVTGRAVIVSPGYLKYTISAENALKDSSIYGNLKWPEESDNSITVTNKDEARDNFILSLLSWTLLQAKCAGCKTVNINMSYPQINIGNSVLLSVKRIRNQLEEMSGYAGIKFSAFRETEANAAYILEGGKYGFHRHSKPNPADGFMIVDIGGGTTDISVCQFVDDSIPFTQKIRGECSFKYAGRELVDIPLIMNEHFAEMWQSETELDVEGVLKSVRHEYAVDTRDYLSDSVSRAISSVGFILDHVKIKNDYMIHRTAKERLRIKYKYISFFYLVGRYLAALENSHSFSVRENALFKLYMSGCASNGIYDFCVIDDNEFVEKCTKAVIEGYNTDTAYRKVNFEIVIPDTSTMDVDIKEAVAIGLTLLSPDESTFVKATNHLDLRINNAADTTKDEQKLLISDDQKILYHQLATGVSVHVLKQNVKNILDALKILDGTSYSYDELTLADRRFLLDCMNGISSATDERYLRYMKDKIGDSIITYDFIAMYIVDVFLNMRKNICADLASSSYTGKINSSFNMQLKLADIDLYRPVSIKLTPIYSVSYKIDFPDKFNMHFDDEIYTIDNLVQIERRYKERLNYEIKKAINDYPGGINTILLYNKGIDIAQKVIDAMNYSEFSDAGMFVSDINIKYGHVLKCDEVNIMDSRLKFLPGFFNVVTEKKKSECIARGNISGSRTFNIPTKFELKTPLTTSEVAATFEVKINYTLDDTDFYFAYRGFDLSDDSQVFMAANDFATNIYLAVVETLEIYLCQGLSDENFKFRYEVKDLNGNKGDNSTKTFELTDVAFDFSDAQDYMFNRFDSEFHLDSIELSSIVKPHGLMTHMLEKAEKIRMREEANALAAIYPPTIENLRNAVALLEPIADFEGCREILQDYTERLNVLIEQDECYNEAKKVSVKTYNIKKLQYAIAMLDEANGYKDSVELMRIYEARLVKARKLKKIIRRLLWAAVIIAILYWLGI